MQIYSFDWATKKALTVYDSKTKKVKQIPNSIEEFGKFLEKLNGSATFLFEFGGGDTFKIMAFRAGHTVLQVPGKKIKDYRDSKGMEKSDEADAKLIYDFYIENGGGGTKKAVRDSIRILSSPSRNKSGGGSIIGVSKKLIFPLPSSIENKEGGSAILTMRNSRARLPSPFYSFKESDADISALKIVFRQHEDLKKSMVREKNKLSAFKRVFEIANVADKEIEKTIFQLETSIIGKEKAIAGIKKILEKKVKQFEIWNKHLRDIKAVGPVIASGLFRELGGKHFDNDESLKHYAGMVAKKEFHDYNRYIKVVLYQFAEQVIRHRTLRWRELYDNMKAYYQKKHEDWSKGKVNNYAKKFIETKFLVWFWEKWEEC